MSQAGIDTGSVNPRRDGAGSTAQLNHGQHPRQIQHRLSFDQPSGVIALPEEEWLESDSDEEFSHSRQVGDFRGSDHAPSLPETLNVPKQYSTYYHHPERRKRVVSVA